MRVAILTSLLLFSGVALGALAAPPSTTPIKPSTRRSQEPPKQRVSLMNGAVKFMVPEEWNETDRSDDGKNVQFHSPDGVCTLMISVKPQDMAIPASNEAYKEKIKNYLIVNMKKYFQDSGIDIRYGPKSETDDRFYLRLHDTIKEGDDVLDEIHLYRTAGIDLLMVTTVVKKEKRDEARPYHTVGEDTCLSMTVGAADKPKKK